MTLNDRAASVNTREDLVTFIAELRADYYRSQRRLEQLQVEQGSASAAAYGEHNHDEIWGNTDLPSFLEAMAEWSKAMDVVYSNINEDIGSLTPWRIFADILMASTQYE